MWPARPALAAAGTPARPSTWRRSAICLSVCLPVQPCWRGERDQQAAVGRHERVARVEHLHALDARVEVAQREVDAGRADALAAALDRGHVGRHHHARVQVRLEHAVEALLDWQRVVLVLRPRLVRRVLERRQVQVALQALGPEGEPAVAVTERAVIDVRGVVGAERVGLEGHPGAEHVGVADRDALDHLRGARAVALGVALDGVDERVRERLRAPHLTVEACRLALDELGLVAVDGLTLRRRRPPSRRRRSSRSPPTRRRAGSVSGGGCAASGPAEAGT